MNKDILNTGVQDFINNNLDTDIMSVLLKKSDFDAISSRELAEQIEAKNKCKNKLPSWYKTKKIYYPNKLNIEQFPYTANHLSYKMSHNKKQPPLLI